MNVDEAASDVLKSFYRGDTLDLFYEILNFDSEPLDISGFQMEFSMKLNPMSDHWGKHDLRERYDIPFDGNSRKGLGKLTLKSRDTLRLVGKTPYTYFFELLSPHGEKFTLGSDLVTVSANPTAVPHAFPYVDNPTVFPKNANSQILIFDFSKLKSQKALMADIKRGLATPYSNPARLHIDELHQLPVGKPGGLAGLDNHGKLPISALPDNIANLIQNAQAGKKQAAVYVANDQAGMLALRVKIGDLVHRADSGISYTNSTGKNVSMSDWTVLGAMPLIISATAPTNPEQGQRWFNTTTGRLGVWYDSGAGGTWVST